MLVEKDLFVLQEKEHFILYAPTALTAFAVTAGVIQDLQECTVSGNFPEGSIRDLLLKTGVLHDDQVASTKSVSIKQFSPTSVTLFTTSDCGLRCIYCYASAGAKPKIMEFEVAKAAIDLIVKNAITKNTRFIDISFHGGGEPLYGTSGILVRDIISYSKEVAFSNDIKISLSCATNGVLSERQLAWAIGNFNRLSLSIDGPPDIQNAQRPLKTGGESAPFVERTIAYLEKHNFNYGVRSTITRSSVNRLTEIVAYLHNIAPSARIHFEPLFSCGRCATTGAEAPDSDAFVKAFLDAKSYAAEKGFELFNSGASIDRCSEHFCGATQNNFCVTPWGNVTSCYEVSLPSDPLAKFFFFGDFNNETHSFVFNESRLAQLNSRCASNIDECRDCFLKYACAGDCSAKSALKTGTLLGGFRCKENRMLGASAIIESIVPIEEINRKEPSHDVRT